jgi:predicted XRE-type DNA-binding protein
MSDRIPVQRSSGNVFADLGIEDPEGYLAKAGLAARIMDALRDRKLTQKQAGELLGISQPKVSALLKGRLDGFSTDRLFRFLNLLGSDVRITVSKSRPNARGHVSVVPTRAKPGAVARKPEGMRMTMGGTTKVKRARNPSKVRKPGGAKGDAGNPA